MQSLKSGLRCRFWVGGLCDNHGYLPQRCRGYRFTSMACCSSSAVLLKLDIKGPIGSPAVVMGEVTPHGP